MFTCLCAQQSCILALCYTWPGEPIHLCIVYTQQLYHPYAVHIAIPMYIYILLMKKFTSLINLWQAQASEVVYSREAL